MAARGGDDLWTEIRRRRVPDEDQIPEEFFPPRAASAAAAPTPLPPPQPVPAAVPPPMAVEHHETFAYRQTVVHLETAGYQEAVAHQETAVYAKTALYDQAVEHSDAVGHAETVAYQETTREEAPVAQAERPPIAANVDDDLTLPAANELFGRRREFVPNQDVEDFGEGEEFEIDLDAHRNRRCSRRRHQLRRQPTRVGRAAARRGGATAESWKCRSLSRRSRRRSL